MIKIQLNKADYEYDIYSLIQAFYPGEDMFLDYATDDGDESDLPYQVRNRKKEENDKKEPDLEFIITYSEAEKEIQITAIQNKKVNQEEIDNKIITITPTDPTDRPNTRNELKRAIYSLCRDLTGKTLPWGTLTGIRPTKVALNMLMEGETSEAIEKFMSENYMASHEKIDLGIEIAKREKSLLSNLHTNGDGYSLYIGIPFCPTTCLYCSFPSYGLAEMAGQVDRYLEALKKEIMAVVDMMQDTSMYLDTIYMGGGTPTSLTAEKLDDLLKFITETAPMEKVREFTVEAGRPDSITMDKLMVMKKYNISRISINPQTMNQKTLDLIGRRHSTEAVKKSFQMARQMGFDNINMDVILGLPGETKEDVAYTFSEIQRMKPDNLTVHSLAIKTKSRLHEEWDKYREYAMDNSNELMAMAHETAAALGMKPYYLYRQKNMVGNLENVGFAVPGKEGIYNILIMEEVQTIMACGAGTVSKRVRTDIVEQNETAEGKAPRAITRCDTVKDAATYIDRIDQMIQRKQNLIK